MAKAYQASGKRKKAIARATLTQGGTGIIRINKIPIELLTPMMARWRIKELLLLIKDDKLTTVNINIDVKGGGSNGQIDAARTALARVILKFLKKKKVTENVRGYDRTLISGDSRQVESKKWGGRKARSRFQKSFR